MTPAAKPLWNQAVADTIGDTIALYEFASYVRDRTLDALVGCGYTENTRFMYHPMQNQPAWVWPWIGRFAEKKPSGDTASAQQLLFNTKVIIKPDSPKTTSAALVSVCLWSGKVRADNTNPTSGRPDPKYKPFMIAGAGKLTLHPWAQKTPFDARLKAFGDLICTKGFKEHTPLRSSTLFEPDEQNNKPPHLSWKDNEFFWTPALALTEIREFKVFEKIDYDIQNLTERLQPSFS